MERAVGGVGVGRVGIEHVASTHMRVSLNEHLHRRPMDGAKGIMDEGLNDVHR